MGKQELRSNGFSGIGLSFTQTKYNYMKTITFLLLLCFFSLPVFAQSDGLPRGAHLMPYTRYEATSTSLGGGATLLGPTFDQTKVQSEASDRICASLSAAGSSVSWTTTQAGQGLVLRYSIPDGQSGALGLFVNNTFVQNINVTTKWSWQYFAKPGQGDPNIPSNTPNPNATQRMRFDEVRVFLANSIPAGATVRLQKGSDGITYMVDFIELEPIPQAVAFNPATMRSVTEFGAVPNDGQDDMNAFNSARIALQGSGRSIYIPAGTFNLGSTWHIETNISIQGAGIWYTTLYFTSTGSGGIVGNGDNVQLRDFYMNGENTIRNEYKGLTGGYGINSVIERLWIEHFEVGAWITTWTGAITNGLRVSFCQFRNNYADGINLSRGSSNCIVEQCDMRNNGDDAMATWSAFDGPQQCFNNEFRFCTAENTWRAGGIGFFGGGGHKGHHLLIKDSTENGIRINSDFPTVGNSFSSTLWIEVYETTVIGCGTNANLWHNRYGAVDIFTRLYNVQNFRLRNVDIQGSQKDAAMIYDVASPFTISNLEFINVTLNGAGLDGNINNYTSGTYDDYAGHGIYVLPETNGSMTITNTNICNTPSGQTRNDSSATFVINGAPGSTCSGNTNNAPVANAGPDQNLTSGTTSANLSGSATDANGDPITFSWSQISGPTVTIADSSSANTAVTGLSGGNTYVFRLSASDGKGGIGVDDVQITVQSPPSNLPAPWVTTDVGAVAAAGNATFNSSTATFTVNGSGADIWDTADEFRYVYQPINGDVTITARVASLTNTNAWAKAGVMIRASTAAGSQHAFTAVTPGNGLNFQRRTATNGVSDGVAGGAGAAPYWVRLQRVGNTFTSSASTNGATWTTIGSATISMGASAQVGLAVTSHADGVLATATFTNVQISVQPPSTQNPFPGPNPAAIPGTIESENFDTGGEGVAYHDSDAANQGGQGRTTEGVDIEACSEGGLNIGWTTTGEWYEYTVNVATAGNYNIDVRAASMFAGGTFHIEFNGVDKTGLFTTVSTNGWQNWTTISKANIALTAGVQVMRVFLDNANFNLNRITFTSVGANVPVTGVTVSPTSQSLALGGTVQLVPTVAPANATNKSVTYSSNNTAVATVNSSGLVSAVAAGSAVITVTTVDQGRTATSTITVTGAATAFRIKNRWQNTYLHDAGDRVRYSATASGTTYNWVIEDMGGGQKEIRNVGTGEYMHIENLTGYVQCTARTVGWMSSRWTLEDAGGGFIRFKNVWQPSNYIHVENLAGHAQHGTIFPAWESAQWILEPVSGGSSAIGVSPKPDLIQHESLKK